MDSNNGFRSSQQHLQFVDEIVQSVAMLTEDDQLPAVAVSVKHLRRVLQQSRELLPLAVCP